MATLTKRQKRIKRHFHVRKKITGTHERPRLAVFRSAKHIYAQLIDDRARNTLATVSTLQASIREQIKGKTKLEVAHLVGKEIAKKASSKGITQAVFDRGGFKYHGRVKALSGGARESGLKI